MSAPPKSSGEPITDRRQLVEWLGGRVQAARPRWRIGTEHEKFCFRLADLRRLPYEGAGRHRRAAEGLTAVRLEPGRGERHASSR